ncbi:MAG: hypothetical protein ABSC77_12695 [Terracidiphilus sp.]
MGTFLGRKKGFSGKRPDFPGDFSEAISHHVGYFGMKNFPQALIPNGLKIICKFFGEIYTPQGYRGGGGWGGLPVDSEQELPEAVIIVHVLIVRRNKVIICKDHLR